MSMKSGSDDSRTDDDLHRAGSAKLGNISNEENLQSSPMARPKRKRLDVALPPMAPMPSTSRVDAPHLPSGGYSAPWQWMQSPWMAQQHMQPPPWMMSGPSGSAPYLGGWDAPSQPLEACSPDNTERESRRRKRRLYEKASANRSTVGMKPHQLRVLAGGEIDSACDGKNAWDDSVRTSVPGILDLSVLEWEGQKSEAIQILRHTLNAEFEYVGHPMSMQGFRNAIKRYMKAERSRLKAKFMAGKEDCPVHVEPDQWKRLKAYWKTELQQVKAAKMVNARAQVKNYTSTGRKGKAGKEGALLLTQTREGSPANTEVAVAIQQSGRAGSLPSGVKAASEVQILALESEQKDIHGRLQEVLVNHSKMKNSLQEMKSMPSLCMAKMVGNNEGFSGIRNCLEEATTNVASVVKMVAGGSIKNFRKPKDFTPASPTRSDIEDTKGEDVPEVEEVPAAEDSGLVVTSQHLQQQSKEEESGKKVPDVSVQTKHAGIAKHMFTHSNAPMEQSGKDTKAVVEVSNDTEEEEGLQVANENLVDSDVEKGATSKGITKAQNNEPLKPVLGQVGVGNGKGIAVKKVLLVRKSARTMNKKVEVMPSASVIEAAVGLLAASKAARQKILTPRLYASPTKKRGHPKPPITVVAEEASQSTVANQESRTKATTEKKAGPSKFEVGHQVLLMNPKSAKQAVASGVISGLGGQDQYHFIDISNLWFKIDVKEAIWPHVSLMFPNENADQLKLKDVVKSNTLWEGKFMKLAN